MDQHTGPSQPRKSRRRRLTTMLMVLTMLLGAVGVMNASPVAAKSSTCVGAAHSNINVAKQYYRQGCGQAWNYRSGQHKCEWRGMWSCSGPRTEGRGCHTSIDGARSETQAKLNHSYICGTWWQNARCDWFIDELGETGRPFRATWYCSGNQAR